MPTCRTYPGSRSGWLSARFIHSGVYEVWITQNIYVFTLYSSPKKPAIWKVNSILFTISVFISSQEKERKKKQQEREQEVLKSMRKTGIFVYPVHRYQNFLSMATKFSFYFILLSNFVLIPNLMEKRFCLFNSFFLFMLIYVLYFYALYAIKRLTIFRSSNLKYSTNENVFFF